MCVTFCSIDRMIEDLEGELEDSAPGDHAGQLYRAQSDMTIMPKTITSRGINLAKKPPLIRQNRSIDPHKHPPLALTQTWLSKESGISLSMEDEVIYLIKRLKPSNKFHLCAHMHTHTHKYILWTRIMSLN